jgi:hypothetical protein
VKSGPARSIKSDRRAALSAAEAAALRSHSGHGPSTTPAARSIRSTLRVVLFTAPGPVEVNREDSAVAGLHLADVLGPLLGRHLRRHDHAEADAGAFGLAGTL